MGIVLFVKVPLVDIAKDVTLTIKNVAKSNNCHVKDIAAKDNPQRHLVYVVCFGSSQIYVIDPQLAKVIDQIQTGKGPNVLEFDLEHQLAFVANFLENTIGVIDLNPSHPSFNRMVLRIGITDNLVKN